MDTSSAVTSWLSFGITATGLGGLITQISAISDLLDPFHANRTAEYLGMWFQRQARFPWWMVAKPPPEGPRIVARLSGGFCGINVLHLTRVPLSKPAGKAGWAIVLAIFHPQEPSKQHTMSADAAENAEPDFESKRGVATSLTSTIPLPTSQGWESLKSETLVRHQQHTCIPISRTTLITLMLLTNAREVFSYSDASGFRAGYASYNGLWYLAWPIGQEAIIKFAAHDSHSAATDVYPPSFIQRVDRCVQMAAGVVAARSSAGLQVGFCGRKARGEYVLEHVVKGFPGSHGSRHLYNMMGGKVYEVDFMFARRLSGEIGDVARDFPPDALHLLLPTSDETGFVTMVIPKKEQEVICHALDCLPWNSLSWSIHRGLKDILIAYAKPTIDIYRGQMATLLKQTYGRNGRLRGTCRTRNSGDLVRVVTDIVLAIVGDWDIEQLDEVHFWRRAESERSLDLPGLVALTKMLVVEWSKEFDYQMYHDLPISLYFA